MTLKTQLRRGLLSMAACASLAVLAAAQGKPALAVSAQDAPPIACAMPTLPVVPVAADDTRGDAEDERADWRALLPAMVLRTSR
jgi:hypothetical protein